MDIIYIYSCGQAFMDGTKYIAFTTLVCQTTCVLNMCHAQENVRSEACVNPTLNRPYGLFGINYLLLATDGHEGLTIALRIIHGCLWR
jgi:hypothetical protein